MRNAVHHDGDDYLAVEPVDKVCAFCGGRDVKVDAWATWDRAAQEWRLSEVFYAAFCELCDCETTLRDVGSDVWQEDEAK